MPTATPFNNLITFSRGSNATVTGPNGLIQWAPSNVLLQSESLDNASWTKQASTITANNTLAPDGTITADKIVEAATTAAHGVRQSAALSALTATLSFYAKKAEREFVNVWAFGGNIDTTATRAGFNLTTGVATVRPGQTATIQDVGNGWYRCSVSIILTAAGSPTVHIGPNIDALTQDYTGDGTSGAFIWGAQLEIGSTATTYNPTTVKNLLGFSEAFDNAFWAKTGSSVVTGAQANPVNNLFNAQKLMEDTSNGVHRVFATPACSSNTPYTYSVFVKAAGRTQIRLLETTLQGAIFDLVAGTVVSSDAGVTASIAAQGSGWYRCRITATTGAAQTLFVAQIQMVSGGLTSYTGDGNSGVYIYGAQLSDSASLDPYVPTPGAAPSSTAFYGPRFDFDPVTRAPRGLLVEEQRTNLILRSEELDNAGSWAATDATVSANTATSPSGAMTADKLSETATTARHFLSTVAAVIPSAATYNVSVYAKAAERSRFNIIASGGTPDWAWFDLSAVTATVGSGTGAATITAVGSGWYRCTFTIVATAAGAVQFNLMDNVVLPARLPSYAGTAGSGLLLWGTQAEAGAFATSYIPTVASTVTRSADVATITGQNFAQWYRQDEGAFVSEFDALTSASLGSANVLSAYASGTNLNRIWMWTGAPGVVRNSVVSGGSGVSELTGATLVANTPLKAASSYRVDSYAFTTNGGAVGSDTSGALPVGISVLGVGNIGGPSEYLNGHIRNIRFIPARAADFQLQAL